MKRERTRVLSRTKWMRWNQAASMKYQRENHIFGSMKIQRKHSIWLYYFAQNKIFNAETRSLTRSLHFIIKTQHRCTNISKEKYKWIFSLQSRWRWQRKKAATIIYSIIATATTTTNKNKQRQNYANVKSYCYCYIIHIHSSFLAFFRFHSFVRSFFLLSYHFY